MDAGRKPKILAESQADTRIGDAHNQQRGSSYKGRHYNHRLVAHGHFRADLHLAIQGLLQRLCAELMVAHWLTLWASGEKIAVKSQNHQAAI